MDRIPRLITILALVAALLSLGATAIAKEKVADPMLHGTLVSAIEQNLAIGISHRSQGVHVSAMQTTRDLKALLPDQGLGTLVIPLMAVLKNKNADPQSRLMAALTLHELKSDRGDFAISQTALFDGNTRLAKACAWLAYERKMDKK